MNIHQILPGRVAGTLLLLLIAMPALAQEAPPQGQGGIQSGTQSGNLAGLRRITASCRAEAARFCPASLDQAGAPRPREQLICLRPYRTSLSLPCRAAVNAMTRR